MDLSRELPQAGSPASLSEAPPGEKRRSLTEPRSNAALERVVEASQDIDRRGRREEALDGIARHAAIGGKGPEGLIPVVEDIVDADECLEVAPAGGQAAIEHPVGGERRL